jgi:(p)ppGpp synthase/HD superfamily hydrolase
MLADEEAQMEEGMKGIELMSVDGFIMRAAKIASEAHKGQMRKDGVTPYVTHPMRVAGRVMLLSGVTPIEVAAAWLHDVLEDTKMTREDLKMRGMPEAVITLVGELTNPSKSLTNVARERRKAIDCAWLKNQSTWTKKIKLIDRIDNLQDMSWKDIQFISIYCNESRLLSEAIGDADKELNEELLFTVDYYEQECERYSIQDI